MTGLYFSGTGNTRYCCVNHCPTQAITLLGKRVYAQSTIEKYLGNEGE